MNTDNKTIYICHTYFHLLISIIKSMNSRDKNTLLITTNVTNRVIYSDNLIIDRIKNSGIFDEVILIDDSKKCRILKKCPPLYYLFIKKISKKYKKILQNYSSINVFNDETFIGKTLTISNIKYNLIEDGMDSMKNPQYIPRNGLKDKIMSRLKIYQIGQSPNIQKYEVNDRKLVPKSYDRKKIEEKPREDLFKKLSEEQRDKLLKIFGVNTNIINANYDLVLLTQPFDVGYPFISEKEKINIYKTIIDQYGGKKIVIKTHPREETDYKKYFPECDIIYDKFPVELLNFLPVKFKNVITVSSTAAIYNTDKTTVLGWDWLDKETSGAIYGKK